MEETRMFAFFKDGIYYKANSTQTKLLAITSNVENWMTQEEVENLSDFILALVADYDLVITSTIPEDEYKVRLESYDVVCTTDKTHISTKGMRWLIKASAVSSDTCKIIFSFDNRNTWYTFNQELGEFQKVQYKDLYSKGTPVSMLPAISKEHWDQIFQRTALDYAVSVNTGETFTSLTLSFPANTAPDIEYIELSADTIHDETISLDIKVVDFEEDDMRYELYINDAPEPYKAADINPLSHGKLHLTIENDDLIVGTNTVKFKVFDAKNAFNERTVQIVKNNIVPLAVGLIDNDLFSFTITDEDADTVRYKIHLNDEEIVPLTEFAKSTLTKTIQLPRDKIIFGKKNKLTLYYEDKIKQTPLEALNLIFDGYYYGILFFDPTKGSKDPVNTDGSLSNERFYSTSVGEIIRMLNFGMLYDSATSKSYEIGVINLSNQRFVTTNVVWKKDNPNVALHMSKTNAPFIPDTIEFYDLEKGQTASFFVRLQSITEVPIGDYVTTITAEASDQQ